MSQLALFVAKTCLCLLGDQGEPDGHDQPCVWTCLTCDDTGRCEDCRVDRLLEDLDPVWNASLGRPVVTVYPLYGLFDGAPGWVPFICARRDGRIVVLTAPGARSVEIDPEATDATP